MQPDLARPLNKRTARKAAGAIKALVTSMRLEDLHSHQATLRALTDTGIEAAVEVVRDRLGRSVVNVHALEWGNVDGDRLPTLLRNVLDDEPAHPHAVGLLLDGMWTTTWGTTSAHEAAGHPFDVGSARGSHIRVDPTDYSEVEHVVDYIADTIGDANGYPRPVYRTLPTDLDPHETNPLVVADTLRATLDRLDAQLPTEPYPDSAEQPITLMDSFAARPHPDGLLLPARVAFNGSYNDAWNGPYALFVLDDGRVDGWLQTPDTDKHGLFRADGRFDETLDHLDPAWSHHDPAVVAEVIRCLTVPLADGDVRYGRHQFAAGRPGTRSVHDRDRWTIGAEMQAITEGWRPADRTDWTEPLWFVQPDRRQKLKSATPTKIIGREARGEALAAADDLQVFHLAADLRDVADARRQTSEASPSARAVPSGPLTTIPDRCPSCGETEAIDLLCYADVLIDIDADGEILSSSIFDRWREMTLRCATGTCPLATIDVDVAAAADLWVDLRVDGTAPAHPTSPAQPMTVYPTVEFVADPDGHGGWTFDRYAAVHEPALAITEDGTEHTTDASTLDFSASTLRRTGE